MGQPRVLMNAALMSDASEIGKSKLKRVQSTAEKDSKNHSQNTTWSSQDKYEYKANESRLMCGFQFIYICQIILPSLQVSQSIYDLTCFLHKR